MYRQRVLLNTIPGRQFRGDVDILLCGAGRFEEAVAYQVKRIKVGMSQLRSKSPNKLEELKLAVRQSNLLAAIGFWKVYLYVLTVVDSREYKFPAHIPLLNEIKSKVRLSISNSVGALKEGVGVFDVEFIQSTDRHPKTIDSSGAHLMRRAEESRQNEELTKWIAQIFSS